MEAYVWTLDMTFFFFYIGGADRSGFMGQLNGTYMSLYVYALDMRFIPSHTPLELYGQLGTRYTLNN